MELGSDSAIAPERVGAFQRLDPRECRRFMATPPRRFWGVQGEFADELPEAGVFVLEPELALRLLRHLKRVWRIQRITDCAIGNIVPG